MEDVGQENKRGRCSPETDTAGGKGLIKTILDEMKCVFNKAVNIDDVYKKEKAVKPGKLEDGEEDMMSAPEEAGVEDNVDVENTEPNVENKLDASLEERDHDSVGLQTLQESGVKALEECGETNSAAGNVEDVPSLRVDTGEEVSCVVPTQKSDEESDNLCKKTKSTNEMAGNFKIVGVHKAEGVQVDGKDCTLLPGKRSLRSQVVKTQAEVTSEVPGVKRSARRRSKDSPRESVLQSAIARKEKSFSNLSQSEEKSFANRSMRVGLHRSPRHSPTDRSQAALAKAGGQVQRNTDTKTKFVVPKSPRLLSQAALLPPPEVVKKTMVSANKPENMMKSNAELQSIKKASDFVGDTNVAESAKLSLEANVKLSLKTPSGANTAQTYTKTGKRRYKPFKGLRYSFTGGTVRKTKIARRQIRERTWSEGAAPLTSSRKDDLMEKKSDSSAASQGNGSSIEGEGGDGLPADQCDVQSEPDVSSAADSVLPITAESLVAGIGRSDSPVVAEACQSALHKRKLQPDDEDECEENGGKRCRQNHIPSPSPADDSEVPSKPESTAISNGAGTAAVCLCQIKSQVFVTVKGPAADLYCQAVDMMDNRFIGCSNPVSPLNDMRMYRPSVKVPFLLLCDVHINRLVRHNCCPGCGVFCTQGRFVRCTSLHLFHRDCQMMANDSPVCPHCGLDSPANDSLLTLGVHKNPVFLPQQKPPKKIPSAKMSFGGAGTNRKDEGPREERLPSPPLVPSLLLTLPTGQKVTTEGLPSTLDKDKLAHLLHLSVACGMNSACNPPGIFPRHTLKTLYNAAKSGNAEKLLAVLAAGLNPNHQFRECSMGSALHAAAAGGHLVVVHMLLQAGAQLDMMDREQRTPLMLAAASCHNEIVKYLIKAGASVSLKGGEGQTALHMAAKAGNVEACHYLLSVPNVSRMLIDCVDDGGWTALVWAAEHCHIDVVRYLLEQKADPLVRDAEQNIALHWSAYSGSVDISEMLLNYGCQVNCSNSAGDTPLHIGARQNKYNCVLLLLARGARVDLKNDLGETPLNCCLSKSTDCYTAISLNVQLQALAKPRQSALRILCNDISRGKELNPIQCVNVEDEESEPKDYVYVNENCFTSNISVDRTITSLQSCRCSDRCQSGSCDCAHVSIRCWYDKEGRLLPDFNYADPPMLFECNQACTCNRVTCTNRVVQHGLTVRFQLFRTVDKGWGVRTLRPILKGSYVCEYIGEIISDCEADHREDDSYLFDLDNRDGETYCIDARHYGNVARFINHMCVPNLTPVRIFIDHQDLHFPRIAFFAKRDIESEEELGFDYGEKFWIIKCKSFTCTCGAPACRYSDVTIKQTLENYNARLLEESQ